MSRQVVAIRIFAESGRRPASLDIITLTLSLMGLLGLISIIWILKTGTPGVPRILFLFFLAMACAPFTVALVRAPKLPFLIPPIVAIFLLYPIGAPHGFVYSTDPIFNFNFTYDVVENGVWSPGSGSAFARTYSFYPLGNVFVAYVILTAGLPPAIAYIWIQPVLRLLAIPPLVYALGRRLFGPRIAALGLLFYLGSASILFNAPIQQGLGVLFVGLALLSVVILTQNPDAVAQRRTQFLFALVAAGIVMTHHLSSYLFAAWLVALAVLMVRRRFRPEGSGVRLTALVIYFIAVLNLYIAAFTYNVFFGHEEVLERVISRFLNPDDFPTTPGGTGRALGHTFATFEIAWMAGSVLLLLMLALIAIRRYRRGGQHAFAVANGLVACIMVVATLPLIATPLSYVPLRISEFSNFLIAPLAASTLIRWTGPDASMRPLLRPWRGPWTYQEKGWLPPLVAVALAGALFMGGSLAPINLRMYFEPEESRTTDSPVYFGKDALRASEWARDHFARDDESTLIWGDPRLWGDQLAVDVFAGFGDMRVDWGSSRIFEGDTFDPGLFKGGSCLPRELKLCVGDYVVIDNRMRVLRPNFFQEPAWARPLSPAEFAKFETSPRLALVYQDGSFSVYRVMS